MYKRQILYKRLSGVLSSPDLNLSLTALYPSSLLFLLEDLNKLSNLSWTLGLSNGLGLVTFTGICILGLISIGECGGGLFRCASTNVASITNSKIVSGGINDICSFIKLVGVAGVEPALDGF